MMACMESFKNLFNWEYDKSQIPIESTMVDKEPFLRLDVLPLNIILICCFIYILFIFLIAFKIKKHIFNSL